MEKDKIIYKGFIQRAWSDPVWSKIISATIIAVITIIYTYLKSILSNISFEDAFILVMTSQFEVYKFICLIIILIIFFVLFNIIRRKTNKKNGKFDTEQKIGNYTFRELYNSLLTHTVSTPINLIGPDVPDKIDLLAMFILYMRMFNTGGEWEGDHFTYYELGPRLMSYGLTKNSSSKNKLDSLGLDIIETSEMGYEFWAMLEKWRIYNDGIMNDKNLKVEEKNRQRGKRTPPPSNFKPDSADL